MGGSPASGSGSTGGPSASAAASALGPASSASTTPLPVPVRPSPLQAAPNTVKATMSSSARGAHSLDDMARSMWESETPLPHSLRYLPPVRDFSHGPRRRERGLEHSAMRAGHK